MVILDTNVLSALMLKEPDPVILSWLDRQARTSVWTTSITIFEIRFGLGTMPAGRRRTDRQAAFAVALKARLQNRVLAFDIIAAEEAAILMEKRQRAGIIRELRDTMIAGIAQAQRAALATRNVKHFDDLSVPVVNPWQA